MSQVQSIGSDARVRAAIQRAANASGVDFDFLLAQAKIESNLDPKARAGTSSAAGLYQFTNATWLQTLVRHGSEAGLDANLTREQAMALRFDPDVSAMMAAGLAADNRATLTGALGHAPDASELYLAHFLGADGAVRLLNAAASDPGQPAAALLPAAAAANRAIFSRPDGSSRSVSEVMGLVRGKLSAAMESGDAGDWTTPPDPASSIAPAASFGGPIARDFHAAAAQVTQLPAPAATPPQRSMAQVLEQAFALGSNGAQAAPQHVRTAYARLSALGL